MSIFDFLKKSAASGEPLLAMEPQSVRYTWFTMQLPAGWQFTQADNRSFAMSGPGGFSVEAKFMQPRGFAMSEVDKHREFIVKAMQGFLESPSGKETKLMTGVIWMEATDVQGRAQRLRIALFNTRPRDLNEYPPPLLMVTCTLSGPSAGAAFDAESADAFREALRSIKWN